MPSGHADYAPDITFPLSIQQGGTGLITLTLNGVLVGNGTSPVTAATGSNGQVLQINAAGAPVFQLFNPLGINYPLRLSPPASVVAEVIQLAASPTADALQLADSGGRTIFELLNTGNITWPGTLTSTGAVSINAGGTNQAITLAPSGTGATLINSSGSGNVGIGTAVPGAPLTVARTFAADTTLFVLDQASNNSAATRLDFTVNTQGTVTGRIAMVYNQAQGRAALAFSTYNAGLAEGSRLDFNGNLGIGTTAPGAPLTVARSFAASTTLLVLDQVTNNGVSSLLDFTVNNQGTVTGRIAMVYNQAQGRAALAFSTYNAGLAEAVRIDFNGFVGIGNTAPAALFSVGSSSQFQVNGSGLCIKYGGNATVVDGLPSILATVSLTGQTAAIGSTNILTPPANGIYRLSAYLVITTAGTTGNITMNYSYTDETGANTIGPVFTVNVNVLGNQGSAVTVIFAKTTGAMSFTTLLNGVGGSPVYSLYIRLEKIG